MAQVTSYSMEGFLDDVRETFGSTNDPLAQARAVSENLKTLLATPGWLEGSVRF